MSKKCDECNGCEVNENVLQIDFSAHMMVVSRLYKSIKLRNIIIILSNILWIAICGFLIKN